MMTLEEVARLVNGTLMGDGETKIKGVETIEGARPGDLTFALDVKRIDQLAQSSASAVLVPHSVENCALPCVHCDNPKTAFELIAHRLRPPRPRPSIGVSERAWISPTARLGRNVNVYPGAYIGDGVRIGNGSTIYPGVCILDHCVVGADVTIYPNAVLYERSIVNDRVIIHANAVIGAFGFGYESDSNGHQLSPQFGHVEVGEDVDIGACTTVDRGTFGTTRIGAGSKLDNQVMIGHNCQIGEHNLLCSQVGIAGSCQTGSFVVMAGQVGIGDHLKIGEGATLGAKSGVMHNLEGGQTYFGAPAGLARERFQVFAAQTKLPQLRKEFKQLSRQVQQIAGQLSNDNSADGNASDCERAA